jgi:hypothetical protein
MPRDREEFALEWVSGVNRNDEPFIHLVKVFPASGKRDIIAQLDPWQTRDCALNALSAAEAAQSDAMVTKFMREKVGLDPQRAAMVLLDFRNLRSQYGTSTPADESHWNAVMDDIAVQKTGKPFDPTKKQ